jgi:predicted RNA methylase
MHHPKLLRSSWYRCKSGMSDRGITWQDFIEQNGFPLWHSEKSLPEPKRLVIVDEQIKSGHAYQLASSGTSILWRGDFHHAKMLLDRLSRRVQKIFKPLHSPFVIGYSDEFHRYRRNMSQRAKILDSVLLEMTSGHGIILSRAPHVAEACSAALNPSPSGPYVCTLRQVLGFIGSWEWRKKGVVVNALSRVDAKERRIYPHYGVFAPITQHYVDLLASAPLPACMPSGIAIDVGTGTGVLSAVLVHRGVSNVVGTDCDPRAIACAQENINRLGIQSSVTFVLKDLFPSTEGRAALIVCNPPWLPGTPSSSIERAIFDPSSRMLYRFLEGVKNHLLPHGEAWLIMSNIAEILGLRSRETLLEKIEQSGLLVLEKIDHSSSIDFDQKNNNDCVDQDVMGAAKRREIISLWRLGLLTGDSINGLSNLR